MPAGLDMALNLDLSPMRPNEYLATESPRWNRSVAIRNAYQDGVEAAKAQKRDGDAATKRIANMRRTGK